MTEAKFRKCGYTSDEYGQYDSSPDRGCGTNSEPNGCHESSTTFGFLTHSDQFTPELMQGTRAISYEKVGRRFSLDNWLGEENTVSGRQQNWVDEDGSASSQNKKTFIVSGFESAEGWWAVDDQVVFDEQGPTRFIDGSIGERGLAHLSLSWDKAEHDKVGITICGNGDTIPNSNPKELWPCVSLGTLRHAGPMFASSGSNIITARGEIVGPVGGFGWILELDNGAPKELNITHVEVLPETPLLLSIPYPVGTTFNIGIKTPRWCNTGASEYSCTGEFKSANSVDEVRTGNGDLYHVDGNGVLTFRITQPAISYVLNDEFFPKLGTPDAFNVTLKALKRFERDSVLLPKGQGYGSYLSIEASCASDDGVYCSGAVNSYDPEVCPSGHSQKAYDYCCSDTDLSSCLFANA